MLHFCSPLLQWLLHSSRHVMSLIFGYLVLLVQRLCQKLRQMGYIVMLRARMFRSLIIRTGIK